MHPAAAAAELKRYPNPESSYGNFRLLIFSREGRCPHRVFEVPLPVFSRSRFWVLEESVFDSDMSDFSFFSF
jgi:hypothetical protein